MNMMLDEICAYLRNWFLMPDGVFIGDYTIGENVAFTLPFLTDGQYYRIIGSLFNDGIHQYGDELIPEHFHGAVWALAIPPALITIAEEIDTWSKENASALQSPYQSESFGGYSYSLQSGTDGGKASWQDVFGARLARWRKI